MGGADGKETLGGDVGKPERDTLSCGSCCWTPAVVMATKGLDVIGDGWGWGSLVYCGTLEIPGVYSRGSCAPPPLTPEGGGWNEDAGVP